MSDKPIVNQDIIDFRYKLIEWGLAKDYLVTSVVCNDGHTNVMTHDKQKVLNDVLVQFNIHFRTRGYDLG